MTIGAPTRRSVRLRRTALVGVHLGSAYLSATLLASRLSPVRRQRLASRLARQLLRYLDVRVTLRGSVPSMGSPVLVVANHVSWLDMNALNTVLGARFVAKSEVQTWPIAGTIAARFGTLFIVRWHRGDAARVRHAVAAALGAGQRVVVFPEGTTTDGTALGPFHPALFQSAIDAGVPVLPVAVRYLDGAGLPTAAPAFIGDMTFVESLARIVAEPTLEAVLSFGPTLYPGGRTRKELAASARQWIAWALGIEEAEVRTEPRAA